MQTKKKVLEFDVEVNKDKQSGAYWGKVQALPGCYSQGTTEKELLEHMKEAIELYLETVEDLNKKRAKEKGFVGIRKVAVYAQT